MAIPTSRAKEKATIHIDTKKCNGCGKCVSVCKDFSIELKNGKVTHSSAAVFGCIGCGHCMAICPHEAITITGREISPDDLFNLAELPASASFTDLLSLFKKRRSIREFQKKEIEKELIEKILEAARTSPMGLPPSDVNVLIFDSFEKNKIFAADFCRYLNDMKWFVSDWFLGIMRPFWGKENDEMFRGFVKPLFKIYTENIENGVNLVSYDAPLAMYFYGSPYTDPADPIVAATTAMYAAESLGLGTCMLGGIHPLIQSGRKARKFREKHGIKFASREGLFVIFGYPAVKYSKGIRRTFASETYLN